MIFSYSKIIPYHSKFANNRYQVLIAQEVIHYNKTTYTSAHSDVVPTSDNWSTDPFNPEEGEIVKARGAFDNKGLAILILLLITISLLFFLLLLILLSL